LLCFTGLFEMKDRIISTVTHFVGVRFWRDKE
jgi:hypothetical protein